MFVRFEDTNDTLIEELSLEAALIPRKNDLVILNDNKYPVMEKCYDLDDNKVIITLGASMTPFGYKPAHDPEYDITMNRYYGQYGTMFPVTYEQFQTIVPYAKRGEKLMAVKTLKETTKTGLKEAKDFCDLYFDFIRDHDFG